MQLNEVAGSSGIRPAQRPEAQRSIIFSKVLLHVSNGKETSSKKVTVRVIYFRYDREPSMSSRCLRLVLGGGESRRGSITTFVRGTAIAKLIGTRRRHHGRWRWRLGAGIRERLLVHGLLCGVPVLSRTEHRGTCRHNCRSELLPHASHALERSILCGITCLTGCGSLILRCLVRSRCESLHDEGPGSLQR